MHLEIREGHRADTHGRNIFILLIDTTRIFVDIMSSRSSSSNSSDNRKSSGMLTETHALLAMFIQSFIFI